VIPPTLGEGNERRFSLNATQPLNPSAALAFERIVRTVITRLPTATDRLVVSFGPALPLGDCRSRPLQ